MADLAARPGTPTPAPLPASAPARPAGATGSPTRVDAARRARLWRDAWRPFWVWSDVPAPELPAAEPPIPRPLGLAGDAFLQGLDAVRRRMWARHVLHGVFRAAWLALALAALWVALSLPTGWPLPGTPAIAALAGVAAVLGLAFAVVSRPSRRRTARMLDRTFGLRERLTTAVEDLGRGVPREGERAPLVYLQMADAANAMDAVRGSRSLRVVPPIREVVLVVFWGLVLTALVFLRGVGGGMPPLAAAAVPVFAPAAEQPEPAPPAAPAALPEEGAPTVQDVLARADRSNQARRDLQELAAALADHAVTRPAAEAIGRGDYEAAADDLRALAPDAPQISPAERASIGNDLRDASQRMAPDGEGLRQSSQEAATGLEQGEQAAEEGLRGLAESVEQTGEQVAPQNELAEQMRQAQQQQQSQGGQRSSQGGQSPQGGQRDPNAAQPGGQQGQSGQAGEPGQGADAAAQAGEAGEGQGQQGDQPQSGEGQGGQSGQEGQPGGEGDQGDGGSGAQPGEGQAGGQGQEASGDSAEAGAGAGAGSGEGQETAAGEPGAGSGSEQNQPGEGEAAEQRVSEGDGAGADPGALGDVSEAIALPPGGAGQRGVQTANDGGGALPGAGAGVTAGGGSATQGEVGEAGPDSNHVPAEHRDLVESYFTLPEAP